MTEEWRQAVARGYDKVSERYCSDEATPPEYREWILGLLDVLPPRSRVLDAGCGCGVPLAGDLADAGHLVTGIDLSTVQVDRARQLVPLGTFVVGDILDHPLPEAGLDAVVALYSLIHVPVEVQASLIGRLADALVDNGVFLATAWWGAWTGSDTDWMGTGTEMRWSHADRETYAEWVDEAGLDLPRCGYVPDGTSGHALVDARRRSRGGAVLS